MQSVFITQSGWWCGEGLMILLRTPCILSFPLPQFLVLVLAKLNLFLAFNLQSRVGPAKLKAGSLLPARNCQYPLISLIEAHKQPTTLYPFALLLFPQNIVHLFCRIEEKHWMRRPQGQVPNSFLPSAYYVISTNLFQGPGPSVDSSTNYFSHFLKFEISSLKPNSEHSPFSFSLCFFPFFFYPFPFN